MRNASCKRVTGETDISMELNLDGTGCAAVATGHAFFDHMLDLLARHSLMDLTLQARGDLEVDAHHTVENALKMHWGTKRALFATAVPTCPWMKLLRAW